MRRHDRAPACLLEQAQPRGALKRDETARSEAEEKVNHMNSNPISGIFTVKSDQDGDWYEVEFKLDHQQIWSAQPMGFIVKFTEIDSLYHVEQIIGTGRSPELVRARTAGVVHFLGQLSRDSYFTDSKFQDHREAPSLPSRSS